jgi:hypothetical protein
MLVSPMPRSLTKARFLPLLLLAVAMTSPAAWAQEKAPCPLCGTWSLVDRVDRDAFGSLVPDPTLDPRASGILTYDRAGNVAVQIMNRNPETASPAYDPSVQPRPRDDGSEADSVAYFGTYAIDANAGP